MVQVTVGIDLATRLVGDDKTAARKCGRAKVFGLEDCGLSCAAAYMDYPPFDVGTDIAITGDLEKFG